MTARAKDAALNESTASNTVILTLDATPPLAPIMTGVADAASHGSTFYTSELRPAISGTAEANSTVTVHDGSSILGTTTANESGTWTFTTGSNLTESNHDITVKATDAAQNQSSSSSPLTLIIDTIAPASPVLIGLAGNTSVGSTIHTNGPRPAMIGTAESNSTVNIYNGTSILGSTTADENGDWNYTPPSDLATGTYTIAAKAYDFALNLGAASNSVTLIIDLNAPAAPVITSLAGNSNVSSTIYTNGLQPTFTGTAESNSEITIFDGTSILGTATADGSGEWSYTPSSSLSTGTYVITAKATDAALNLSPASISATLIVDTEAPAAPNISSVAGETNISSTVSTSLLMPPIAGVAEPNSTVTIYNNGSSAGTTTTNESGAWLFTPSLTAGTYTITAKATDRALNQGSFSTSVTLVIDTNAPAAPEIVSIAGNTSLGSTIFTNGTRPVMAGTAENDSIVTIYQGSSVIGMTTADGSGEWTYTPATDLATGTYNITAKASDAASNQGPASVTANVVIDTTAPSAPIITSVVGDTSVGSTIYTNVLTPSIAGTAEANSTVTIYNDASTLGTATTDGSGGWVYIPSSNLSTGTYTITAKATDAALNESLASVSVTAVIDTTAPTAPSVTSTTPTNNTAPTWTWTSGGDGGNGHYRYKLDSSDFSAGITETTSPSYTPGTALSAAVHTLYVQERDDAGNWSASGSFA
ncbi:MAG: hemagglutinin, partial [Proteobacteria bacterium]|nr:hemagglutinin [Pseudomonadota bacterium]